MTPDSNLAFMGNEQILAAQLWVVGGFYHESAAVVSKEKEACLKTCVANVFLCSHKKAGKKVASNASCFKPNKPP